MQKLFNLIVLSSVSSILVACNHTNQNTIQPQNTLSLAIANNVTLLSHAICQDNTCTWNNSANKNITQGESDGAYCTGTNTQRNGSGYVLGSGAYNMTLPHGIAPTKTGVNHTDVILELFNTPFNHITHAMLQKYAEMGYTTIWISPPQYSAAVPYYGYTQENIPAWYGAYQPMDFGKIGNEHNVISYGNATELANLVNNAHSVGLKIIVDYAVHQMAQPGSNYSTSGESTHYYHTYENQTYIFDQQNIAPISQFWWPQTTVAGYIPYANSANSCASFANNPHNIALWGNNPNGNNYNAQISTTTEWSSDFSAMSGWFGILPATTNSIVGSSGTSCGTQSVFDGFAAWMLGYNHTSGTMHDKANATAGFNMDGLRIDDISEQSPAFFTQLFHDIDNHSKSSNLYFGEYPTDSANNLAKFTSINTSSANSATGNTLRVLNFPLVAGLKQAFATGANLQESLTSMISGQYAYMSGNNGSLTGNNAINLVVDQDTVPDSIRTRDMCPATGNNEFVMNSYITPLAYGIILAMEAGTPFIYTDPQAEKGVGVDYEGKFVAKNSDGSVSYWNENEVIAGVYFHNQTLGKAMEWVNIDATSGTNIAALTRGDDYLFVVNKSSHDYATTHSHANMKNGCYIDLMSHQIINITNSTINQLVIPSQAVMYFVPYSGAVPSNAGFSC